MPILSFYDMGSEPCIYRIEYATKSMGFRNEPEIQAPCPAIIVLQDAVLSPLLASYKAHCVP
jgi:hypothetical protein